jgi:hypothetical protein
MGDQMASDSDRERSNNGQNGNNGDSHSRRGNEEQHVKAVSQSHRNEINKRSV